MTNEISNLEKKCYCVFTKTETAYPSGTPELNLDFNGAHIVHSCMFSLVCILQIVVAVDFSPFVWPFGFISLPHYFYGDLLLMFASSILVNLTKILWEKYTLTSGEWLNGLKPSRYTCSVTLLWIWASTQLQIHVNEFSEETENI